MVTHWEKQLSLSKETNSDQDDKENSTQKQPSENHTNIIIYYLFQRCFKRCKLITVLRSTSHDINDKIFNIVGMATAASRCPQPRQGFHLTHSDICILSRSSRSEQRTFKEVSYNFLQIFVYPKLLRCQRACSVPRRSCLGAMLAFTRCQRTCSVSRRVYKHFPQLLLIFFIYFFFIDI